MATVLVYQTSKIMKQRILLVLLAILIVGSFFRLWQLGAIPVGPNWDEAAIAYNGWSIWQTRRDEWLARLPLSFRSFGDYKAPLAIYANGVFTTAFGFELWAIRLPFALSGCLSILIFYSLLKFLWSGQTKKKPALLEEALPLLGALFLAFSPWHLLFSRAGFESGLALTELLIATVLLLQLIKSEGVTRGSYLLAVLSAAFFSITFYTYHSAKLMVPLFFVYLLLTTWKSLRTVWRPVAVMLVFMFILLTPFLYDSIRGEGLTRANVTIFAQSTSLVETGKIFVSNTLAQFSPNFLLFAKADSIRHSTGTAGVLTYVVVLLALLGLLSNLPAISKKQPVTDKAARFIFVLAIGWIVSGTLPAVIGLEVPHPNRALLALPGYLLLATIGSKVLWTQLQTLPKVFRSRSTIVLLAALTLIYFGQIGWFLADYFSHYQARSSQAFQDGYIELYQSVWDYLDADKGDPVQQVVITSEYGQPYIYALITGKINPIAYHNGALVQFLFPDQVQLSDLDRENALVVSGKQSGLIDRNHATKIIYSADGEPIFWLFDTRTL